MNRKPWIKISLFLLLFSSGIVLMVAARKFERERVMKDPNIIVHVEGSEAFLNQKEILDRLVRARLITPRLRSQELKPRSIETTLTSMEEIKTAQVYQGIGGSWVIEVWLRNPIARIFTENGQSFYLDSDGFIISKAEFHTARVLVISGNINEPLKGQNVPQIINNPSLKNNRKLDDFYRISNYVCKDSVLQPLIGQVYLDKTGDFVLVPIVGDQKIVFGSAETEEEVENKFTRLKVFYQEVMPFEGWEKYEEINVKYEGQIVGRKRGATESK
ncbi:MAG: cell division protein FtsQ/DivIB [Flavobacteriales bacterium]